jgi:hypothetical protein
MVVLGFGDQRLLAPIVQSTSPRGNTDYRASHQEPTGDNLRVRR